MKQVIFVRHGEGYHQLPPNYLQTFDPELTELGITQAKLVKLNWIPNCLVVSPSIRTLQTAEIIAQNLSCPLIVHEDCREGCNNKLCNHRSSLSILKEKFPSSKFDWSLIVSEEDLLMGTEFRTERKDEVRAVRTRAHGFLLYLSQMIYNNIIVVTHQGFIRCVLSNILELDTEHSVSMPPNCGLVRIAFDGDRWSTDEAFEIQLIV